MILVVAGPINIRFARLVAKVVKIGTRTLIRFFSVKKLPSPDGFLPSGVLSPGTVRARIIGSAVCIEK